MLRRWWRWFGFADSDQVLNIYPVMFGKVQQKFQSSSTSTSHYRPPQKKENTRGKTYLVLAQCVLTHSSTSFGQSGQTNSDSWASFPSSSSKEER
mmetsp:Transcript_4059/g.11797  ORF Transcript_4059/g.11797 Transcript_4059/m.11797 type:complete len:95 (+) Transcript_4059:1215-1499(+)